MARQITRRGKTGIGGFQKMKICNIGWAHSPHVHRIARWFAQKGHDISIISDMPYPVENVKIYDMFERENPKGRIGRYKNFEFNISWKWLRRLEGFKRAGNIVKSISPDLVHCHSLWFPGYCGAFLGFQPYVVSVFNGDVLWTKDDITIWQKARTKIALKNASLVVGESDVLIKAAIDRGADSLLCHVMKIGVDLSLFNGSVDKITARKRLRLPETAKIILSPRSISSFYNIETIIRTIPRIVSILPDALFVFIGHSVDSGYLDKLKRLVQELGVDTNALFAGKVEHNRVAGYHQAADVFVSVSPQDSGPMALQEAMACGAAPVISDLPSVRELVREGYNGLLVNPGSTDQIAAAVKRLLQDTELRKSFVKRNFEISSEKCDMEKEMRKMEELYYQTVKKKAVRCG